MTSIQHAGLFLMKLYLYAILYQRRPWLAGTIVNAPVPHSYNVKLPNSRVVRSHADHICPDSVHGRTSLLLDETISITVSVFIPLADSVALPVPLRCSTRISFMSTKQTVTQHLN